MVSWPWPGISPLLINLWLTSRGLVLHGLEHHASEAKVRLCAGRWLASRGGAHCPTPQPAALAGAAGMMGSGLGAAVSQLQCGHLRVPSPWKGLIELVHLMSLGKVWSGALSSVKAGMYVLWDWRLRMCQADRHTGLNQFSTSAGKALERGQSVGIKRTDHRVQTPTGHLAVVHHTMPQCPHL